MPKLAISEKEKRDAVFRGYLDMRMKIMGVKNKEALAKLLGIGEATMYSRYRDPESFKIEEVRRLFKVLHYSEEEQAAALCMTSRRAV